MAHHTINLSPSSAVDRRWSPRSTLILATGLSALLWAALVLAVIAVR
jgi:hypothetical protein